MRLMASLDKHRVATLERVGSRIWSAPFRSRKTNISLFEAEATNLQAFLSRLDKKTEEPAEPMNHSRHRWSLIEAGEQNLSSE